MKAQSDHKNPVCWSAVQPVGLFGVIMIGVVLFSCGKSEPESMDSGSISIPPVHGSQHGYVGQYLLFYKKEGSRKLVTRLSPMLVCSSDMKPYPGFQLSPDGEWSVFRKDIHGPIPLPGNGAIVIYHGNKPNFLYFSKLHWSEKELEEPGKIRNLVLEAISESKQTKTDKANETESDVRPQPASSKATGQTHTLHQAIQGE